MLSIWNLICLICANPKPLCTPSKSRLSVVAFLPTWKSTIPITKQYLKALGTPVVRVDAKYTQYGGSSNHAAKECSLPALNALAEKAKAMLLVNFVVEVGLFNGSVGIIVKIVYKNSQGPREKGAQPAYVVVNFPNSTIPVEDAWDPENPTHVPIPLVSPRCENQCCSMTTIPLRVCKAITIYKSQGATVGKEELWEYLVVSLPAPNSQVNRTPGLAQVGCSRASELNRMALLSTTENPVTGEQLKKIGTGPAYVTRRTFETRLRDEQAEGQRAFVDRITDFDDVDGMYEKTFNGGYDCLVRLYRNILNSEIEDRAPTFVT